MPAMALTAVESTSSEAVACGVVMPQPQQQQQENGTGKQATSTMTTTTTKAATKTTVRRPFLATCAPPGMYPPAPTCPGDDMMWHCHGANYEELVSNLQKRGILTSYDAAIAMSKVDRKLFVPRTGKAYNDSPQVIGYGATISAPHMHSHCLSLLAGHAKPGMSVLDVGSGSGYLTAVFGLMVGEKGLVVGVEHIPELVERSIDAIKQTPAGELMDKGRIIVLEADGKLGNEEGAPYDCIHVGAAAAELPEALVAQLRPGGRMVIPVGTNTQDLVIIDKLQDGTIKKTIEMVVRYVPLI